MLHVQLGLSNVTERLLNFLQQTLAGPDDFFESFGGLLVFELQLFEALDL